MGPVHPSQHFFEQIRREYPGMSGQASVETTVYPVGQSFGIFPVANEQADVTFWNTQTPIPRFFVALTLRGIEQFTPLKPALQ